MHFLIIAATGNEDKIREIRQITADKNVRVISMKEAGILADPVENGSSFEENALIKARAVAALVPDSIQNAAVIADDSGLVVDALGGMPGIYSARYLGRDTDYLFKMKHILHELEGVTGSGRSARFTCACACVLPGIPDPETERPREIVITRSMEGEIGYEIKGENGFGYDPFFYLPQYQKTSSEISEEEKNAISHRGQAFRAMLQCLEEYE